MTRDATMSSPHPLRARPRSLLDTRNALQPKSPSCGNQPAHISLTARRQRHAHHGIDDEARGARPGDTGTGASPCHLTGGHYISAADYFAGCTLIPKRDLKRAWGNGIQRTTDLAHCFGVSEPAIRVRLAQTGLSTETDDVPAPRCARPVRTPRGHNQAFRPVHPRYSHHPKRSYA